VTVATCDLEPGDVALAVPERLLITLDTVFEADSDLAEALTTNPASELSCLALFLMYEKRAGAASPWAPLIRELDRIQARGAQGAKSPLLWEAGQAAALLAGSPLADEVDARQAAIAREYAELDTIWFMAPPLFDRRSGERGAEPPTEAFSLALFRAAYAAVQASVVHLQGVPSSKRFALVPLGPPLLQYSSTSRAALAWTDTGVAGGPGVVWTADAPVAAGAPIAAWCGPQPNRRLLLNYGIVDEVGGAKWRGRRRQWGRGALWRERGRARAAFRPAFLSPLSRLSLLSSALPPAQDNPFDEVKLTITLPTTDPLYSAKRAALQRGLGGPPASGGGGGGGGGGRGRGGGRSAPPHAGRGGAASTTSATYSTQHAFRLTRAAPLPADLLPYLRLALSPDPAAAARPDALEAAAAPGSLGPATEAAALGALTAYLQARLARYPTTVAQDDATVASEAAGPREKVAARLVRIEKGIWGGALAAVRAAAAAGSGAEGGGGEGGGATVQGVRLS